MLSKYSLEKALILQLNWPESPIITYLLNPEVLPMHYLNPKINVDWSRIQGIGSVENLSLDS